MRKGTYKEFNPQQRGVVVTAFFQLVFLGVLGYAGYKLMVTPHEGATMLSVFLDMFANAMAEQDSQILLYYVLLVIAAFFVIVLAFVQGDKISSLKDDVTVWKGKYQELKLGLGDSVKQLSEVTAAFKALPHLSADGGVAERVVLSLEHNGEMFRAGNPAELEAFILRATEELKGLSDAQPSEASASLGKQFNELEERLKGLVERTSQANAAFAARRTRVTEQLTKLGTAESVSKQTSEIAKFLEGIVAALDAIDLAAGPLPTLSAKLSEVEKRLDAHTNGDASTIEQLRLLERLRTRLNFRIVELNPPRPQVAQGQTAPPANDIRSRLAALTSDIIKIEGEADKLDLDELRQRLDQMLKRVEALWSQLTPGVAVPSLKTPQAA